MGRGSERTLKMIEKNVEVKGIAQALIEYEVSLTYLRYYKIITAQFLTLTKINEKKGKYGKNKLEIPRVIQLDNIK